MNGGNGSFYAELALPSFSGVLEVRLQMPAMSRCRHGIVEDLANSELGVPEAKSL